MKKSQIRFEFEVEVVGGEEGHEVRLEQARAIRDLFMWLHTHRGNPPANLIIGLWPTRMST